jgi:hypothetical protein
MATKRPTTPIEQPAKAAAREEGLYIACRRIDFDGEVYAADEQIVLSRRDADPLLAIGAVKPAPQQP